MHALHRIFRWTCYGSGLLLLAVGLLVVLGWLAFKSLVMWLTLD